MEGKAKIDFEKWVRINWAGEWMIQPSAAHQILCDLTNHLNKLPPSMKFGVIQDFFDSVGIYVSFEIHHELEDGFVVSIGAAQPWRKNFYTREKAREAAIKKACEIYNER